MTKKTAALLLSTMAFIFTTTACDSRLLWLILIHEASKVPVTGVTLNKTETALVAGGSEQLIATIAPSNATNKDMTWTSEDATIATVSGNGTVTALAVGKTTITVTTSDGGKTATCEVTVAPSPVPVTGIMLNKDETTIFEDATEQLTATVVPPEATNQNVEWTSDDDDIASVSPEGLVTAHGAGFTVITATTDDGGYTATCEVTISPFMVPVTGVSLNVTETSIEAGESEQLVATISPPDASNQNVAWYSSDEDVAAVSSGGMVLAIAEGEALITVTTDDGGFTDECLVTVLPGSGGTGIWREVDVPGDMGPQDWQSITSSSDGSILAAVSDNGIYVSMDEGTTWSERTIPGIAGYHSIASSANGTNFAVAVYNGYIYTSSDYGVTWIERNGAGHASWTSIASSSDGTRLAAVQWIGYIFTSTDGGQTWIQRTSGIDYKCWSSITSSSDGTRLAACAIDSYIYTSDDGGLTWIEQTDVGNHDWWSIAMSSDGTRLAVVESYYAGIIKTSIDGGASWTLRSGAGTHGWYSISSSSDGKKLTACVMGEYIYTSFDSGVTWIEHTGAGSRMWASIASSSDGLKLAAVSWQEEKIYIYR